MSKALVTVICLCHNQKDYVKEALESVLEQTHREIQLIVIDDASTDGSKEVIAEFLIKHKEVVHIDLYENLGSCKAFNRALPFVTGEYLIDLAADDVMLPNRIARQIDLFESLPSDVGVVFTDATYIDEDGDFLRNHYEYLFRKKLLKEIPQGDVYAKLISRYFIASPTMMARTCVLESLGGYDESLAFEDFDFWIRSSRLYKYTFLNESLTKIRKSKSSMSTGWYKAGDRQLHSTYLVCRKAQKLNRNAEENESLVIRVRYEIRQSVFSKNIVEAKLFFELLCELTKPNWIDRTLISICHLPIPFRLIRNIYHTIRFS